MSATSRSTPSAEQTGPSAAVAGSIIVGTIAVMLVVSYYALLLAPSSPNCLDCGVPAFAWGVPVNESGTTPAGCPTAAGHYCYSIEVAGSDIQLQNLSLSLRSSNGTLVAWPAPPWADTVHLINANSVPAAEYSTSKATWSPSPSYSGVTGGESIVIYTFGLGPFFGLRGLALVASSSGPNVFSIPSTAFA